MLPVDSDDSLREQLTILDGWYDKLGDAGKNFKKALKIIGTYEHFNPQYNGAGAYYGVGSVQFINTIAYGPRAVAGGLSQLFNLRTHEGIHAVQAFVSAAVHASPLSTRTTVMLCPRDFIKLNELAERGAYSGALLFSYLLDRVEASGYDNPIFSNERLADDANRPLVEQKRQELRDIADAIMNMDEFSLKNEYNERALTRYEAAMATSRAAELADGKLRFVQLEEEDIAAIGNAFTLNPFTDNDDHVLKTFMDPVPLSPEIEARLQALNARLGIEDESRLPTFGQALAEAGSDREQFLIASITGAASVPVLGPPQRPPGLAPM
jgi:hypothetical protein